MNTPASTPARPVRITATRVPRSRIPSIQFLRALVRDRWGLLAALVLFALTTTSFLGPPVAEQILHLDVNDTNVSDRYQPPSSEHLLGTDRVGRDQFLRLLYGGRISLLIAYSASVMSISIGLIVGILAGYYGGWVDDGVMWFISTLRSIPAIFLLLIAASIWSASAEILILILGLLGWVETARLVRGRVISLKSQEFIIAARSLGCTDGELMLRHLLPNVVSLAVIALALNAGTLILAESGLSFLGLGVQPPTPTWGNMLTDARTNFTRGIHLVVWPGLLISLAVICFYLLGDGLRDVLDPRRRRR